jgi:hypothetical protein
VGVVLLEEALEVKAGDDGAVGRVGIGLGHARRMRGQSAFLVPGAGWLGFYTLRRLTCAISGKLGVRARPGSLWKKGVAIARTVTPDPARDSRVGM